MRIGRLSAIALLALVASACGDSTPVTPASPSATTTGPAGATINGTVQGGSAMLAASTGAAAAGLTVGVVGTDISTTVSGTGQFMLTGVPAGATQLRFSGPGVDAVLSIAPVQGNETITLTVALNGNEAVLKNESHEDGGKAEVNGTISALSGTAASFQFRVGTRLVRGDAQTEFFGDGNRSDDFSDLHDGWRVEVKGLVREGFVYAQRIHINPNSGDDSDDDHDSEDDDDGDDDEEGDDEAEVKGTMSGLSGTCPSISFTVSGKAVATNDKTEFSKVSCGALKNGDRVKAEGRLQANGVILAREVKRD